MPLNADYNAMAMFLLGLTGTGHCLGMCGPLVVAIPGRMDNWWAHPAYHMGRLITYTLTGACLGGISGGLAHLASGGTEAILIWTVRLQVAVSALAAVVLLVLGLHRMGFIHEPRWLAVAGPHAIPGAGGLLTRAMRHRSFPAVFLQGLMLGWLPCGLSYAAFVRTLASGNMLTGGQWALVFGLGTLPGLLVLGTGAGAFLRRHRLQSDMVAGLIMIGMAVSLAVDLWTSLFH